LGGYFALHHHLSSSDKAYDFLMAEYSWTFLLAIMFPIIQCINVWQALYAIRDSSKPFLDNTKPPIHMSAEELQDLEFFSALLSNH
jgi:hypothetical protein